MMGGYVFTGVCLFNFGGVPHPRSVGGGYPIPGLGGGVPQVWVGGTPSQVWMWGVPHLGLDGGGVTWGTPQPGLDRVPPPPWLDGVHPPPPYPPSPPPPSPHQHSEHLLRGRQYASCIHTGGLSCSMCEHAHPLTSQKSHSNDSVAAHFKLNSQSINM